MSTLLFLLSLVSLPSSWAHNSDSKPNDLGFLKVERVIDGDTFVVEKRGRIRLIGVDTPESVDPRRPVEYFGREASNYLRQLIEGKRVRLESDQESKDRYGRTLAYAYLEDGTFINAHMIEQGYAHAYTRFPFRHLELFRSLERSARENSRGLWKADQPKNTTKCNSKPSCRELKTCKEARHQLEVCKRSELDGDGDGIPCEKLCY